MTQLEVLSQDLSVWQSYATHFKQLSGLDLCEQWKHSQLQTGFGRPIQLQDNFTMKVTRELLGRVEYGATEPAILKREGFVHNFSLSLSARRR